MITSRKKGLWTEDWIYPTLQNGWVAYDAARTPRYKMNADGVVAITGLVKDGANWGAVIFTLASEYRPVSNREVPAVSAAGIGKLYIGTLGDVKFTLTGSTTYNYVEVNFVP